MELLLLQFTYVAPPQFVNVILCIASLTIWAFTFFRYGQINILARMHTIATHTGLSIKKDEYRTSLDGLGDRRIQIVMSVLTGASFLATAAALILNSNAIKPSNELYQFFAALMSLVFSWGACIESGATHTFYIITLSARNFFRDGRHKHQTTFNLKQVKLQNRTYCDYKDYMWTSHIATETFFSLIGLLLFCWQISYIFSEFTRYGLIVVFLILYAYNRCRGYNYENEYKTYNLEGDESNRLLRIIKKLD